MPKSKIIRLAFRFPIEQRGERDVEVLVPLCDGPSLISTEAADKLHLSEGEYAQAEEAALRAILVIH